jgi:quercetin dioxygenase-like cupin family protein
MTGSRLRRARNDKGGHHDFRLEGAQLFPCADRSGSFACVAVTAELDPKVLAFKLPDQLKWRDPTGAAPVNQAILHGDPTKPGLYVVLNRFKPGNFSRPHFHPNDRFITVVKGTWWVATGNKFDPTLSVAMPAGSFVTHFANQVHWDGAKDEEAWVLIVGDGPATLTRVEEAK